jgi:outer membrane protein OmpA-like peptidoglycan-associated protein
MKTFMKTTALSAIGALMLAGAAIAGTQDVVRSTAGEVVKNTFNNCVLSNFEGTAGCGDAAATKEMQVVYFDFDSAALTPAAKAKLDVLANTLKAAGSTVSARVVGYADEIGNAAYNQGLSQRRSNAVVQYLNSRGVTISGGLEIRGLGATSSRSQCSGVRGAQLKACLWQDRRVEIEVTK